MPARTHLTCDEQLAAEAAFRGWPVDLKWPAQAQAMYHGILKETHGRDIIEDAGGLVDEAHEYFVGPPRDMPAIGLPAQSDDDLSNTKRRKV